MLGAGLAVWLSLDYNGFGDLEAQVLGPVAFENVADVDPVLRITIEPFPEVEH